MSNKKTGLSKPLKKQLDWILDKLNDVSLAGYGLLTGERWVAVAKGTLAVPDCALLAAYSLILFAVWLIIGYMKGLLEKDNESS